MTDTSKPHSELVARIRSALAASGEQEVRGRAALEALEEQLEAAHRNMDRYGMALAEIGALPENGLGGTGAAPRIALEALHGSNPATSDYDAIETLERERGVC